MLAGNAGRRGGVNQRQEHRFLTTQGIPYRLGKRRRSASD